MPDSKQLGAVADTTTPFDPILIPVSVSTSGDLTLHAAVPGKSLFVFCAFLSSDGVACKVSFKSGSSKVIFPAVGIGGPNQPACLPLSYNPGGWCVTDSGQPLVLNLDTSTPLEGVVGCYAQ